MSVTYIPYNPWKEQILAKLIPTFLSQIRESEKNKKMNALLGELAKQNKQAEQMPDGTMPQTGQADASSITAPGMAQPLDLSSINSVNPASVSPASTNATTGASNAAIAQMLNQAQMQGNHVTNFSDLFGLLSTPRFNGVNAADAISNATPFLKEIAAAEQARQKALAEQQQRERAMAYMQNFPASNPNAANMMQFLLGGDAAGAINRDIAKTAIGELGQLGGRPVSNNLGGAIANFSYSPMTNEYSPGPIGQVTISPDQQSRYNLGMAQVRQSDLNSRRSTGLGYARLNAQKEELAYQKARDAANSEREVAKNAAIGDILLSLDPEQANMVRLAMNDVPASVITRIMAEEDLTFEQALSKLESLIKINGGAGGGSGGDTNAVNEQEFEKLANSEDTEENRAKLLQLMQSNGTTGNANGATGNVINSEAYELLKALLLQDFRKKGRVDENGDVLDYDVATDENGKVMFGRPPKWPSNVKIY